MKQYDSIRDKFQSYQVPVDTDALWNKTSHAIPKKRRKRILFWLITGCMGLFGVLLITTPWKKTADRIPHATAGQEIFSTSPRPEGEPRPSTSTPLSTSTPSSISTSSSNPTSDSATKLTEQPPSSGSLNNLQLKPTPESASSGSASKRQKRNASPQPINPSAAPQKLKSTTSVFATTNQAASPSAPASHQDEHDASSSPATRTRDAHPADDSYMNSSANHEGDESRRELTPITAPLFAASIHGIHIPEDQILMPGTPSSLTATRQLRPTWSVFAQGGIGFSVVRAFSPDPEMESAVDVWQKTQKGLESIRYSLGASLQWPGGLEAGVGLLHQSMHSRIQYDWIQTSRVEVPGTSQIIIDESGNAQYITDQVDATRETLYRSTRYTRLNTTAVNIFLGHRIVQWHRMECGLFIMGGVDVAFRSRGTIFSPQQQLVRFTSSDSPYRMDSPWTWGGGVNTAWHIRPHLVIRSSAGFQTKTYQLTSYDRPLRFRYHLVQFATGLGYTF